MLHQRAWGARAVALLCLIASVVLAPRANAQAPADSPQYRAAIDLAVREYSVGNWEEALLRFRNAHALYPNARTLRGMGLSAYELRDYVRAIGWLTEAVANPNNALTALQRTESETAIATARDYVVLLDLTLEPSSAVLTIDGVAPVRDASGKILINPGEHELVAQAAGYETLRRALRVNAGDRPALELELQPQGAQPASLAAPSAALESDSDEGSVLPWIAIGAGVTVTATGAIFLGMALSDKADVENAADATRWSSIEDAEGRVGTYSALGFVLLGVGIAGTTAAVVWKLSEDSEGPLEAHVGLDHIALKGAF
jgi:tetratricopeptide (TPR) repeat protein